MINYKIVYKIIGSLLFIEAALMSGSLLVSLIYKEDDIFAFIVSIIITAFFGFIMKFMGRNAENRLSRRDSFLVVTLSWALFSLFGTIPFLTGGYLHSFTDAYFETMSGFTTTGATIIDDVEVMPHGILFWRSLTHWIGGLGIVFFTIALLPCRRQHQGVLGRGYRTLQIEVASQAVHEREMDLDRLSCHIRHLHDRL